MPDPPNSSGGKDPLVSLARYSEIITQAATTRTPHTLVHYLRELANSFHSWYNAATFIVEDAALRASESGSRALVIDGKAEARLFIFPGFRFRIVGGLLTNFHLPCSTLLALVCAFAGRENVLAAYHHAVAAGYRFYSYGDCMLIL